MLDVDSQPGSVAYAGSRRPAGRPTFAAAPAERACLPRPAGRRCGLGPPHSQGSSAHDEEALIAVLIADDHPALRAGLRALVAGEPGLSVQGDVDSGEAAYLWYRGHRPDVVVLDLAMGGYGGMEAIHRILASDSRARVLVYTVSTSHELFNRAIDAGALGYVSKGCDVCHLLEGIREVAQGRPYVSPDMIPTLVDKGRLRGRSPLDRLTPREFAVFRLVGEGRSVDECGHLLNLSPKTISNHITQIKSKLGAATVAELARIAIRAGVVEP